MRLLVLPISTRRTLIYCEPLSHSIPNAKQSYLDKAVNKASKTWADWEKSGTKWKQKTIMYGNIMLRKIPFEEWGLKSIPPRKKVEREYGVFEGGQGLMTKKVDVRYPATYLALGDSSIMEVVKRLAVERQELHRKRMIYSIVAMPLSAPFALLPVIPNIPFFYLCYRTWSHWRALSGSRHLQHLVNSDLLNPTPSATMDTLYTAGLLHATRAESRQASVPSAEMSKRVADLIRQQTTAPPGSPVAELVENSTAQKTPGEAEEIMLLKAWNGKLIAERLDLPELEIEIERAVEQVERNLQSTKPQVELDAEKQEVERELGATQNPPEQKAATGEKG